MRTHPSEDDRLCPRELAASAEERAVDGCAHEAAERAQCVYEAHA